MYVAVALGLNDILGGDSVSSVAAVYDRRRCLNCCTVGAHKSAATVGKPRNFQTEAPPYIPLFRSSLKNSTVELGTTI